MHPWELILIIWDSSIFGAVYIEGKEQIERITLFGGFVGGGDGDGDVALEWQ